MKNYISALVLILVLASCTDDNKVNQQLAEGKELIENVKVKGPEMFLNYKFQSGDKFSYRLSTSSNNTEEITADTTFTNEITQNATYTINFRVRDIDSDNSANIEVKITSILAETGCTWARRDRLRSCERDPGRCRLRSAARNS